MVNLVGQSVKHKSGNIGSGLVISQNGNRFIVQFTKKSMKFS